MKLNTNVNCDLWCPLASADLCGRFVRIFSIFCKGQTHPGRSDVDNAMQQFLVWPRTVRPRHPPGWPVPTTGECTHKNDELRSLYRALDIRLLSQWSSAGKTEPQQSEIQIYEKHVPMMDESLNKQHIMLFANISIPKVCYLASTAQRPDFSSAQD